MTEHTGWRLAAILEAPLWVEGGFSRTSAWHLAADRPASYAITGWTIVGGVLLGLGAFVNGACVFGVVARIGSGQWAYALTPTGYFAGC